MPSLDIGQDTGFPELCFRGFPHFLYAHQFRAERVQCEDFSLQNLVLLTTYFSNFVSYSTGKAN